MHIFKIAVKLLELCLMQELGPKRTWLNSNIRSNE